MTIGAADIDSSTVIDAVLHYDASIYDHLIIRLVRMPRVVSGMMVGASLAVAGGIMQGLTRNPLASPGILGVNAGAAFAVVLAVYLLGQVSLRAYMSYALLGAAVAGIIVYGLGSMGHGGMTPLKLTLAGAVFTAFVTSFTSALLISDQETLDQIRFWTAGSLAGRDWELVEFIAPILGGGMIGALVIARQITTISLGEDIARGLGQNTVLIRLIAACLVVFLAGGSVALAGPIAFVGLIAPHLARFVVGADYRWILPYSAALGALIITIGDTLARIIVKPEELPVGVMTALIGAPFFIYLARWKVR
ncbi:MAG: iron ABC transporter permease [Phototrophicales bacterium]|nr:MAG: iron ABC transporter permease [Phototrophicales bacterium]